MAAIAITPGEAKRCSALTDYLVNLLAGATCYAVGWGLQQWKRRNHRPVQHINGVVDAVLPRLTCVASGEVRAVVS